MEVGTETVNEVSEEQANEFFESGGESLPEAEPEAKPEVAAEPEKEEKKEEKYVPLAALHEERIRRKEMQSKIERMEQAFQQFVSNAKKPEAPAFDEDPVQSLKHDTETIKQHLQSQAEYRLQVSEHQKLVSTYRAHANEFAKSAPDFNDAYKFISEQRQKEYVAAGYSEDEAHQFLIEDEMAIVQKAFKDEVNAAERIYGLAKVRGYSPKEDKTQKLAKVEKGIQAGKSLSAASGSADMEVTLESLADLPSDEFNKMWKKLIEDKA